MIKNLGVKGNVMIKKLDLHLHLDGSMTPSYLVSQARAQGLDLPTWDQTELLSYMCVSKGCKDLNEYLTKFALPLTVMQTEEAMQNAVEDLCRRLEQQNVSYAEIRFAPQLHTQKGLSQEQVVAVARKGLHNNKNFKSCLILCCMRMEQNEDINLETVRVAKKDLGKGVVAIDLAGAEGLYPTRNFQTLFKEAACCNVPFTIHAGEADGPDSIWAALQFGAKRIGHGIRCLEDERLVAYLREHRIPLEICITSNLQTRAIQGPYPLKDMLDQGLCVTLNTDNMTVSGTSLEQEFRLAREELGLTQSEILVLENNARYARFMK